MGWIKPNFSKSAGPYAFSQIAQIREDLADEFEPRAARSLRNWPVRLSEKEFAGLPCLVVEPKNARPQRRFLHFFGGGYVSGCPEYDLPILAPLSCLCAAQFIAPRYALAPEQAFPSAFQQGDQLLRALIEARGKTPLSVSGESAGAGLATALVQALPERQRPAISQVLLMSPWCDLRDGALRMADQTKDPTLTGQQLRVCANIYAAEHDRACNQLSPLAGQFGRHWPDTILTTTTGDILYPMVRALQVKLQSAGAKVDCVTENWLWHVFELYDELPQAETALRKIAQLVLAKGQKKCS
ncbi:hypothetical protein NBRC116590_32180 [Pelagimonas sp. KU-00592-HH]|uniref:alpha/beta hydrolase n=1 Tax=Pelagimonas sp. KU-00592-HH TaxID=3127651 RepID=UPI00310373EA